MEGCLSVHACMCVSVCACACGCVCLRLPRGEPHALAEGFDEAVSCWQGSVGVGLVGAQQEQHLEMKDGQKVVQLK